LNGGCLVSGWTVYDNWAGRNLTIRCLDNDCEYKGWVEQEYRTGNPDRIATCDSQGCFATGWETHVIVTNQYLGRTDCLAGEPNRWNCLTGGWISGQPYGPQIVTRCIRNDCAQFGWEVRFPNGGWQRAVCKAGGCFERGWVIHQ
jgi:hypothetical protein